MSRTHAIARGALLAGTVGALIVGCTNDTTLVGVTPANAIFTHYVALGNSITAGWQSNGINDSTQRQSFAFLLAQQMGTRFAYPSFAMPGCPSVTANFVSQKRIDSLKPVAGGCAFRSTTLNTNVLNNVGVPFAYATDLLKPDSALIPVPYPQLILGGVSQIDRAIQADPTFVTFWFGNNEVLTPATFGLISAPGLPPVIPPSVFSAAYSAALNKLLTAPHLKSGVLIGAVKVTNAPRFFSADTLALSATRKADFDFITKKTNTIIGCGASGDLVSAAIIDSIKAGSHPAVISCQKNVPVAPVGDVFILDPTEIATYNGATDAYNAFIKAKADSIGFAYVDPNPLLLSLRGSTATSGVFVFPNLRSATNPFGAAVSLDGVHPSAIGQKGIANLVIDAINTKYGTTLTHAP